MQCFVNPVFLTVMWTHLMCSDFTMESWGLVAGRDSPLCLRTHPLLQAGFEQWQPLRGEFLQYVLGWVSSKHVAQTISRRYCIADEVVIAEKVTCMIQFCCIMTCGRIYSPPKDFKPSLTNGATHKERFKRWSWPPTLYAFIICRFLDLGVADRSAFDC